MRTLNTPTTLNPAILGHCREGFHIGDDLSWIKKHGLEQLCDCMKPARYDQANYGLIVDIRLNIITFNWYLLDEATLFELV